MKFGFTGNHIFYFFDDIFFLSCLNISFTKKLCAYSNQEFCSCDVLPKANKTSNS